MRINRFLFILCSILFVLACGKDESKKWPEAQHKLLSKIKKNGELVRKYSYEGQVLKKSLSIIGEIVRVVEFFNIGDTIIAKYYTDEVLTSTIKYYDTDTQTGRRDRYYEDGMLRDYRIYNFIGDCGFDSYDRFDAIGILQNEFVFEFTDDLCSYSSSYSSQNQPGLTKVISINENTIGYNNSTILPFFRIKMTYNTVKLTIVDDDIVNNERSYDAVFTFDSDGFPIKEIRTYITDDTTIYEYEYE